MYAHVRIHTGIHFMTIEKALLECQISLEWSKIASNATLYKLKTQFFSWGACPRPPWFHTYIPLHSITISACTSSYYHCTVCVIGYHIYIHVPAPYYTLQLPPTNHLAVYIQYMHQIYVHILHGTHSL